MLSHAEIYRRVCEARPECIAKTEDGLRIVTNDRGEFIGTESPTFTNNYVVHDALALITDHWTEICNAKIWKEGNSWVLEKHKWSNEISSQYRGPTRFHALAEFYAPGSTK